MNYSHIQESARDAQEMERHSVIGESNAPGLVGMKAAIERRAAATCKSCKGTGSKYSQYLDCPDCDAADIIAAYELRKNEAAK